MGANNGAFKKNTAAVVGGGDAPSIEFRFSVRDGVTWFGLYATGHSRAVFSGIVNPEMPDQLSAAAKECRHWSAQSEGTE